MGEPVETDAQPVETVDQPETADSQPVTPAAVKNYRESAYAMLKDIRRRETLSVSVKRKLTLTIKQTTDSTKVDPPKLKKSLTMKKTKKKKGKKLRKKVKKLINVNLKVKKLKKKGKRKSTLVRGGKTPRRSGKTP